MQHNSKKISSVLVMLFFLVTSISLRAQKIEVLHFDALQKKYTNNSDTTYIVQFFATWCAPCVKELPELDKFATLHSSEKIKLILVSLDGKKEYKKGLPALLRKNNITTPVILLDEPQVDFWINQVDSNWSGSIPATLIVNNAKKMKQIIATTIDTNILNTLIK